MLQVTLGSPFMWKRKADGEGRLCGVMGKAATSASGPPSCECVWEAADDGVGSEPLPSSGRPDGAPVSTVFFLPMAMPFK